MKHLLLLDSKKRLLLLVGFLSIILVGNAQESLPSTQNLDVSLFWKKTGIYENKIEDAKGDLFSKLGHHGPAVENLRLAYRVYFNASGAVDILSKFQSRLELKTSKWYPKKNHCPDDYGTDNYNVGNSVGLGGINLYDPVNGLQKLGPVTKRTAEVILTDSSAQIIMTSYGIPYQGLLVDIEFRLTTMSGKRHANVSVRELSGQTVQFATGLSTHSKLTISKGENYLLTWGDYNSHAKYASFDVGAALIYNPLDFKNDILQENQQIFISKPCSNLHYTITACNDKEQSGMNSLEDFEVYVRGLVGK